MKSKFLALMIVPALLLVCGITLTACGGDTHTHDLGDKTRGVARRGRDREFIK